MSIILLPVIIMRRNDFIQNIFASMEAIALEALSNIQLEKEKVFYCQIADLATLDTADYREDHEQWTIKPPELASVGEVRVRKTACGDRVDYELTTKIKQDEGKLETTTEIDEKQFNAMRSICASGMIKSRYVFKIDPKLTDGVPLKWEVDVYFKNDGTYYDWCKVDLEYNDSLKTIPTFPIAFTRVIADNGFANYTVEDRELVDYLYNNVFKTKNPKLL